MSDAKGNNQQKPGWRPGAFLKSFVKSPAQVCSVIPSSPVLVSRVAGKMDLREPKVIAEFGPGEGVHTREILKRSPAETKLLLFELNETLCDVLRDQFKNEPRVEVLNTDCRELKKVAQERGITGFDYVFSGIPFSLMDPKPKQELMYEIYESLVPGGAFIIYQVTNELKQFGKHFDKLESEWCPINVPPMFVTVYGKDVSAAAPNLSPKSTESA